MKSGIYITGDSVFPKACNGILCAAAGAGKGAEFIVPNLLGAGNYDGSWVVIDPKGQNAYLSADYQRREGREVIILNPWQIYPQILGGDTLNPLDLLQPDSPDFYDDCKMLAFMMIPATNSRDQHWERRARALLVLFMGFMIKHNYGKTLADLQNVIAGQAIPQSPHYDALNSIDEILDFASASDDEELARMAKQFIATRGSFQEGASKEFSGILSTLYDNMSDLGSRRIRDSTNGTSFALKDLSQGRYAIYLVIPSERLESGSRWLRLVITTLMRAIIRGSEARGAAAPFTFLLDEFASLGYMKEIETAIQQYRGYNIFCWPILQDLSQLKNLYPQTWEVFINCALVQLYFGINNPNTAEFVSRLSGFVNVPIAGPNPSSTKRSTFTVQEAMNMSYDQIFCKIKGYKISQFDYMPYYKNAEFNGRYPQELPRELR